MAFNLTRHSLPTLLNAGSINTILHCTDTDLHEAGQGGGEEGDGVPRHPVPAPGRHPSSENGMRM